MASSLTEDAGSAADISPPRVAGASSADESVADITSFVWLIDAGASAIVALSASGEGLSSVGCMASSLTEDAGSAADISPPRVAGASSADESVADITSFVWLTDASTLSSTASRTFAVIDLAILSAYTSADVSGCSSTVASAVWDSSATKALVLRTSPGSFVGGM